MLLWTNSKHLMAENVQHPKSREKHVSQGKREHHGLIVGANTVHGAHHGQAWWCLAYCSLGSLSLLFVAPSSTVIVVIIYPCWVILGCFCFVYSIYKASKSLFYKYALGLLSWNLHTHLIQTTPKFNRRNRGINHTIRHFNPQKWILNT